ncbi:MAG TPA: glycosyltransferase family 4 protein [Bradyrhizobium sp.]|uniref:glycosyltransferase family 4 protein n=1 Tax=Bradyrhizobium sp. TaxID=376 RepID=UPI002B914AA4|nr:glycosyltransferase family 4 protein [Bradyrhizobium sp.]HLZ01629.1 glycosyltransferase family 4 protein [Bradyrhizobium sp.]
MRILMLTSEFAPVRGGIGTYAREVARAASALGADIEVIAPDYGRDNTVEDRRLPFEVRRFAGGLHSMRDLPSKIRLARRSMASGQYDVVHAADWPFFIPVALSQHLTDGRIFMSVHGTEINETQTLLKRLAIKCTGVFGLRTEIIANSRYTGELFRERFAVEAQRVHAIPLGVSEFWFGERKDRAATRAAYGIPPERIVMVTVARITRRKGHPATLAALSDLSRELRNHLTWLVIGPDGEADYVRELRSLAGSISCDMRFMGALPDHEIRDIYGAADFFCLTGVHDPSGRVEGFGLVYLEAGAGRLPSVATSIGGVPDAVLAGRSGLLVQSSIDDIARAITKLAENADLRSALGAGALAHARELSWARCAARTYGLQPAARPSHRIPDHVPPAIQPREPASAIKAYSASSP